jgi:mRNA interferase RelE/StbE
VPVRVEFTDGAVEDLVRFAASGNLPLFFKKLLRLEEIGKDAGLPLGGGLTGWRKIVVGDRNWRILFVTNAEETVATVRVIGDRDDAECYREAQRRVEATGTAQPPTTSLAAVMFRVSQLRRSTKKRRDS